MVVLCVCVCVCVRVRACVCACVCVWGVKNQNLEISVRKEKVKRVRGVCRRQQWTAPCHLCKGRRGHCVGLCKGHPPWHIPTEFVWYMTMYTVGFLYTGILYLATKCWLNIQTTQKLWVLNTLLVLILVIRRVPNHSSWTACFGFFKLSTCSSLLIGRSHSTWSGAQILTQLY